MTVRRRTRGDVMLLGEYGEWIAMGGIGLMSFVCLAVATNFSATPRVRWAFFRYGVILLIFELCIVMANLRWNR